MTQLTSDTVLRGLAFLVVLNDREVFPSRAQLDAFVNVPIPQTARERFFGFNSSSGVVSALIQQERSDSFADYLLLTGMAIEQEGGLRLTDVGRAFELGAGGRQAAASRSGDQVLEVVGRLEDPIVYARLLTEIDKQPGALVVDPYLPSTDLLTLLELPSVERVLTRDTSIKGQKQDERRRHMAIALGARPDIELRFLPTAVRELHDRYVIPSGGDDGGLMIGTSLGGTQLTVVTHLSLEATEMLRDHYAALWALAEKLEPVERVVASPADVQVAPIE